MSKTEFIAPLFMAFAAGALLGLFFFGGLQWTLQRFLTSPRAWLFVTGSMLIRVSVTVAGFYFVGQGDWLRISLCLLGFLFTRSVVLRRSRKTIESSP